MIPPKSCSYIILWDLDLDIAEPPKKGPVDRTQVAAGTKHSVALTDKGQAGGETAAAWNRGGTWEQLRARGTGWKTF